jgi:Putative metallopeptidase
VRFRTGQLLRTFLNKSELTGWNSSSAIQFLFCFTSWGTSISAKCTCRYLGEKRTRPTLFTLLKIGTSFSQRVLANASQGWFLNERRDEQTRATPLYYDEHDLSPQRAYWIVCLMVGSDPVKFKKLADEAKMPESRQQSCKENYTKASRSWDTVLAPYRRSPDQPATKINISYGDAEGNLEGFARTFRAIRILETVAERSASGYVWAAPFTLEMRSCEGPNAGWDDETRTVKICYQLPFDFAQLYLAYVQAAPPQATVNQKPKRRRT